MVIVYFANFVYYTVYMTQINPCVTVTDYKKMQSFYSKGFDMSISRKRYRIKKRHLHGRRSFVRTTTSSYTRRSKPAALPLASLWTKM